MVLRELGEERFPGDVFETRLRQLGEFGVAADETVEVARAVLDRVEHGGEFGRVAALRERATRMRERRYRCERIVELVADHADHLLPGHDFLARQLAGQALDLQQTVQAPVQPYFALREMEGFVLVFEIHVEQAVLSRGERRGERRWRFGDDRAEIEAVHATAAVEQGARGEVRVDHALLRVDEEERGRRILHDGVEQELALEQALALVAQHTAELVVRAHEIAELVAAAIGERNAEVPVAEAQHAAREHAQERSDRRSREPARGDRRQREKEAGAERTEPRRVPPRTQRGAERDARRRRAGQERGELAFQREQAHYGRGLMTE